MSDKFKDLISHMLVVDADSRYTLEQVKSHPFFNEPV